LTPRISNKGGKKRKLAILIDTAEKRDVEGEKTVRIQKTMDLEGGKSNKTGGMKRKLGLTEFSSNKGEDNCWCMVCGIRC
jgi:hypothetical protein